MTKIEQKLQELGYEQVTIININEVKTFVKTNKWGKVNHFIQLYKGKIMNAMSILPKEMQKDLEVLGND